MGSGDEVRVGDKTVSWERAAIEKLLLAGVRERRSAHRWRVFRGLVWMVLFIILLVLIGSNLSLPVGEGGPHTAVIDITGEISADSESSADNILPAMRSALEDPDSKALVLRCDSPGGSPVQAGLINDEIWRLRTLYKKPIYAVVGDTCASAAYYIVSAADKIYANKASVVGSIGVLMNGFGFVDAMDKLGIQRRLYTAGANKGMLDPFSPVTPQQRAFAQTVLDQIHQQFIDVVKRGRGDRLKINDETFSGLFWTGQQAVDQGLVDGLGSLGSVARDVVQAKRVVDYTDRGSIADRVAKRLGASLGAGALHALGLEPTIR